MLQFQRNFNTPTTSTTTTSSNSSITSSSSTSSIYTVPGVQEDYQAIKEGYLSCIGDLKASVAWYIEGLISWGMEADVILNAIQETGWARKPSPHYMRAILERYKANGIKTMVQLLHDQEEHEASKKWYEQ